MTRVLGARGRLARIASCLVIGLVSVGCASQQKGSQPDGSAASAQSPDEIAALFVRERDLPEARAAKAPDSSWSAQFPSAAEVVVTEGEGHSQAEFSLGTEAKTRCVFYRETIDAGRTIDIVLAGLKKKATLEKVVPYRVTSAQGMPVVFLEGRYTVPAPGGKKVGSLKLAVSPRLKTPALCFLDEPGYVETFASAIVQMLGTLTTEEPPTKTTYSELWASSMDGLAFGFDWIQMIDEGQGKWTTVSIAASFLPTGPDELSISDDVEVLKNDAAGVLEGSYYEAEGAELAHELTLTRSGKSKYTVTGKVQGKDFESAFTATKLPDTIAAYRLLRQNRKKSTKLTLAEFSPALDPSAPTELGFTVDAKAQTATIQLGELALLAVLTEDGLVSQLTGKVGEREIKQELLHRTGKF